MKLALPQAMAAHGVGTMPKLEAAAMSAGVAVTGDAGSATSSPPRSPMEQHLPVVSVCFSGVFVGMMLRY